MSALHDCFHCGGTANLRMTTERTGNTCKDVWVAKCDKCGLTTQGYSSMADAIMSWERVCDEAVQNFMDSRKQ